METPNTKHQENTKLQTPKRSGALSLEVEVWSFSGAWCLVFGVSANV
jgi:hypothetical protein